jgi:Cu(I)/Ag(I) efflux system membrane protein CusA/SilA
LLIAIYRPLLDGVLRWPKATLVVAPAAAGQTWPLSALGGEFMPPLDEGDLLYMPSALPGLSAGKAGRAAAADRPPDQDRARGGESVYGKAGRAETATDPAPLEMFETTIQFKPREQWRAGMTPDKLVEELDRIVKVPGLSNIWVPPIRNRIDMLATGIKSPVGVKVAGHRPGQIDRITARSRRPQGRARRQQRAGRAADRRALRRREHRPRRRGPLRHEHRRRAVGRSPPRWAATTSARRWRACSASRSTCATRARRDSLEKLRKLPIVTERGAAGWCCPTWPSMRITDGPPMLRSENARLSGWVYVDIRGRDLRSAVQDMQRAVAEQVKLPPGYSVSWSGQFEFLERATAKLKVVVPFTLGSSSCCCT